MAVDSIQQEDKMEEECLCNTDCNCDDSFCRTMRQEKDGLPPLSWKEIEELYQKDYPEDLWVDPGEVDYDSRES